MIPNVVKKEDNNVIYEMTTKNQTVRLHLNERLIVAIKHTQGKRQNRRKPKQPVCDCELGVVYSVRVDCGWRYIGQRGHCGNQNTYEI